jgi:hypothetical protein
MSARYRLRLRRIEARRYRSWLSGGSQRGLIHLHQDWNRYSIAVVWIDCLDGPSGVGRFYSIQKFLTEWQILGNSCCPFGDPLRGIRLRTC